MTTTRLPARVYWFRRALVLGSVFAVVFAMAHLLGGGSGSPGKATSAAAGLESAKPTANAGPLGPLPVNGPTAKATGTPPAVALAEPDGPCALDEITVTPVIGSPVAGSTIGLTLQLSGVRPACTFDVSAQTLVAKVVQGPKRLWTSQDCPSSVPKQAVVVRSAQPTTIQVDWSGRRSDDRCSRTTSWVVPGAYRLVAAVVGSEPGEEVFHLKTPPQPVVTKTIAPKKVKTTTPTATANAGR